MACEPMAGAQGLLSTLVSAWLIELFCYLGNIGGFSTADVKWTKMVPCQESCTAYLISINTYNPEVRRLLGGESACLCIHEDLTSESPAPK